MQPTLSQDLSALVNLKISPPFPTRMTPSSSKMYLIPKIVSVSMISLLKSASNSTFYLNKEINESQIVKIINDFIVI